MDYKQIDFSKFGAECFPGLVGIEVLKVTTRTASARMEVKKSHFAPNGYLHAGSIVTLADSIAGYGCLYNLPDKGVSFTTIELKSNFLGAIKSGFIKAEATLQHAGKTTQVWDVTLKNEENEKTIALFRCTQLLLY
ncbi:MAG TPA: PaaI family thioesterase [Chitinophagales bacterium]|nr:PaaI family thioesterase [Chitinophagales bacterium]